MTILEYKDQINILNEQVQNKIDLVKEEKRDLNEAETNEINKAKMKIEEYRNEIKKLEAEEKRQANLIINNNDKNINTEKKMKNTSLVKEIRKALDENKKSVILNAETRTMVVQGQAGVHDDVIETEMEGILEPLYANSVLSQLGAKWYMGLPKGDYQIPVMSANTVKWEGETDDASATGNGFTSVKLTPHRLSAYIDISKQLLYQDTIGIEQAVRRDLVKALNDKLEATIFGDGAGVAGEEPAGLFYGETATTINSYQDLCDFESDLEDNNVYGGNMKYVLSPKAKAALRGMIKGTNNSGFVFESNEVDGTPAFVTSHVESKKLIYGDFSNLVIGSWGDVEITFDEVTQATRGCVRLVINAYFDFAKARTVTFGYGDTTAE